MSALVPYQEMKAMAEDIAKSGLFGMKNQTQVLALMSIAQAEGKHPAIVARDYDIIQGRPAKKAEAMLRDFIQGGGKVDWHKMDDTVSDATFSHPQGGTVRITWDMARAQQAELKSKDMYRKYPRQMLRARTVSEGVRAVGPFATSGLYVPEEVREFTPAAPVASIAPNPAVTVDMATGEIVGGTSSTLSAEQLANIRALISETKANEERLLKFMDVTKLGDIPAARYSELVQKLEKKRAQG